VLFSQTMMYLPDHRFWRWVTTAPYVRLSKR